jgi:hypothetical protein
MHAELMTTFQRIRQYNRKFLPSISSDAIGLPERSMQSMCNVFKHLVTGQMAVGVVNFLEIVDFEVSAFQASRQIVMAQR